MRKLTLLTFIAFTILDPLNARAKCISGDCLNGISVYTFSDGDIYAGCFKNGQLHGRGKLGFAKGGYYEGEFKDGKFDGQGILVYADGRTVKGNFSANRLVPPPSASQSVKPWELSDGEIMAMLSQAAQVPNQTKYLDRDRIAIIKQGWRDEQITDRQTAIETALDYLLRVNDHYTIQEKRPLVPASENNDSAMQRFFQKRRIEEEHQRLRDIADGEKRLAAMNGRAPGDVLAKCQADWPDDYDKQKSCIQKQAKAKSWVKAHGGK